MEETDDNEHIFRTSYGERVWQEGAGKGARGVSNRVLDRVLQVRSERADIARQARLLNPDIVIFHSDALARLGVMALYGTRARMLVHRYEDKPIPRGVIKRMVYSRISLWFVPNVRGGQVVEAMGIPRERIRLLRPFYRPNTAQSRSQARTALDIPKDRKVFVAHESTITDMDVLRPLLVGARVQDPGYSVIVSNPDPTIATELISLVRQLPRMRAQLYINDPENNQVVETVNGPTQLAAVPEEVYGNLIAGAADAMLEPTWGDNTVVRDSAVLGMTVQREVVAVRTNNSVDVLGDEGTYFAGLHPTQVRQALGDFTPTPAKAAALKQRADTRYGLNNMDVQAGKYLFAAPARARLRFRSDTVSIPAGTGSRTGNVVTLPGGRRIVWIPDGESFVGTATGAWVTPSFANGRLDGPLPPEGSVWVPDGAGGGRWADGPGSEIPPGVVWVPDGTGGVWTPLVSGQFTLGTPSTATYNESGAAWVTNNDGADPIIGQGVTNNDGADPLGGQGVTNNDGADPLGG